MWEWLFEDLDQLSASALRFLLRQVIPVSWQHFLRDQGFFQLLSDYCFFSIGCLYGLLNPKLLISYVGMLRKAERVQYGNSSEYFALCLSLTSSTKVIQQSSNKSCDVLVFVHGGAWGSGKPYQYLYVAHQMARLLGVPRIAVIGYPTYPKASIIEQEEAIVAAIKYFRGLNQEVILCGHSSGANIALLALINELSESKKTLITNTNDGRQVVPVVDIDSSNDGLFIDTERDDQSSKRDYFVKLFIGLNGVYDIHKHFVYESNRGVQHLSPMAAAASGGKVGGLYDPQGFTRCSPSLLFEQMLKDMQEQESEQCDGVALPPYMVFVHGTRDGTVPLESSVTLSTYIHKLSTHTHVICHCPEDDHLSPLLDLVAYGGAEVELEDEGHHSTLHVLKSVYDNCLLEVTRG